MASHKYFRARENANYECLQSEKFLKNLGKRDKHFSSKSKDLISQGEAFKRPGLMKLHKMQPEVSVQLSTGRSRSGGCRAQG